MYVEVNDFVSEKGWKRVCYAIEKGIPILITGPRGSGKTELALRAARQLGRHAEVCHLGSCVDVEATLQGTMQLRGGETRFVRSRFVEAVSKPFTVVILEELNRSGDTKTQGMLLSCMDHQKKLFLDQEDPDHRIVEVAEGVVFVATANVGADYTGTEMLDAALLDRMLKFRLDYSPREIDVLRTHGLGEKKAKRVMDIVTNVRRQHAGGALTASISTRGLVRVAEMLREGFDSEEAFDAVIGAWDAESRATMRTILEIAG